MNPVSLLPGRAGALAGIAGVLILFASVLVYSAPHTVSDQELINWWSDSGNLNAVVASTFMQAAGALCLIVFLGSLRSRLMDAEGGSAPVSAIAFASGITFVILLLAASGPRGVVAWGIKMGDETMPGVDTLRYMPELSYIILGLYGGMAAAALIAATSVVILRTQAFGRWLGWGGVVLAPLVAVAAVVVGGFFLPLFYIWALATSAAMWRSSTVAEGIPGAVRPGQVSTVA